MRQSQRDGVFLEQDERVVLLDEFGAPIGSESKTRIHTDRTPLHLAFSCYVFDRSGRILLTKRSAKKRVFPSIWTNTCCGHPAPGELIESAIRRRMRFELGLEIRSPACALPTFRYTAEMNGVVENEMCPVFLAYCDDGLRSDLDPNPNEVDDHAWVAWADYQAAALGTDAAFSPWSRLQVEQLNRFGMVEQFLTEGP